MDLMRKSSGKDTKVEMGRFNYYLPRPLAEKLADYAYEKQTSASAIITELLLQFLADKKTKPRTRPKTASDIFREKGF
jgi:hypothetical protein